MGGCLSNGDQFVRTSLGARSAEGMCEVRSDLSEASVLIERMIKSARKLVIEPP